MLTRVVVLGLQVAARRTERVEADRGRLEHPARERREPAAADLRHRLHEELLLGQVAGRLHDRIGEARAVGGRAVHRELARRTEVGPRLVRRRLDAHLDRLARVEGDLHVAVDLHLGPADERHVPGVALALRARLAGRLRDHDAGDGVGAHRHAHAGRHVRLVARGTAVGAGEEPLQGPPRLEVDDGEPAERGAAVAGDPADVHVVHLPFDVEPHGDAHDLAGRPAREHRPAVQPGGRVRGVQLHRHVRGPAGGHGDARRHERTPAGGRRRPRRGRRLQLDHDRRRAAVAQRERAPGRRASRMRVGEVAEAQRTAGDDEPAGGRAHRVRHVDAPGALAVDRDGVRRIGRRGQHGLRLRGADAGDGLEQQRGRAGHVRRGHRGAGHAVRRSSTGPTGSDSRARAVTSPPRRGDVGLDLVRAGDGAAAGEGRSASWSSTAPTVSARSATPGLPMHASQPSFPAAATNNVPWSALSRSRPRPAGRPRRRRSPRLMLTTSALLARRRPLHPVDDPRPSPQPRRPGPCRSGAWRRARRRAPPGSAAGDGRGHVGPVAGAVAGVGILGEVRDSAIAPASSGCATSMPVSSTATVTPGPVVAALPHLRRADLGHALLEVGSDAAVQPDLLDVRERRRRTGTAPRRHGEAAERAPSRAAPPADARTASPPMLSSRRAAVVPAAPRGRRRR